MNTIFEINDKLQVLIDQARAFAEENDGEISESLDNALQLVEMEKAEKIESGVGHIKNLLSLKGAIEHHAESLKKRAQSIQKEIEWFKNVWLAEALGGQKWAGVVGQVAYRKSESVNVIDQSAVPEKYTIQKITTTVDKKKVKVAIKSGEHVDGIELLQKNNIIIK